MPSELQTATEDTMKKSKVKNPLTRTIGNTTIDMKGYIRSKSPIGGVTFNCGDMVAERLDGKTLDVVYEIVAKALKVDVKELQRKYAKLNYGMQRMALGNRLRRSLTRKIT